MMRRLSILSVGVVLALAGAAFGQEQPAKARKGAAGAGGAAGLMAKMLADVDVKKDIEYAKPDGHAQLLDVFMPKSGNGPFPLIVWIHGGGWSKGSRMNPPALPMVKDGYVVASIEYRLVPTSFFPTQVYDCKAAIRWLRANARTYKIDADHIGVWGGSAGGHLVSLLGTSGGIKELEGDEGNLDQSSKVQAVCDYFGPVDFLTGGEQRGMTPQQIQKADEDPENTLTKFLGGPGPDLHDRSKKASPVTYIDKSDPPFLIVHGDKDPLVTIKQSIEFNELLKKASIESEMVTIPGAGHGTPEFKSPEILLKVRQFFDKHLKTASAAAAEK